MIFIVVRFETKPEWSDRWPELVAGFTRATRAEEGNLWFDWSRNATNHQPDPRRVGLVGDGGDVGSLTAASVLG